jgi:hypothetical protein
MPERVVGNTGRSRSGVTPRSDPYADVTAFALRVTAVCARALPVSDAPVLNTIAV